MIDIAENRAWISDWRKGMFSSTSRDAEGWPIKMHGLVMALEDALDDLEMRDSLLIDMADHLAATRNWVIANMGNPDDMDALLARFAALEQRAGT